MERTPAAGGVAGKIMLVQSEGLGRGDDQLGRLLMANMLRVLGENPERPARLIFWNTGVRLVCEGSQVLNHVARLEQQGVEVLACTTCLEYLDLKDKVKVGRPTTMTASVSAMMQTGVISL